MLAIGMDGGRIEVHTLKPEYKSKGDKVSILHRSISAENFSDKFSTSNCGQIST
jgi:hypothetical protein